MDYTVHGILQATGVGSLSLLQGIFPTQELNLGLPHFRRILYQLSHQGSPWKQEMAAKEGNAGLYFEASCVGGVPIIRTLQAGMQGNRIQSIMGIVNGTTNYILTKMSDEGLDYADVLKEAQRLGYAEANPSADVDGFDSMYKLSILSSLCFHKKVPLDKIYREGISKISKIDIDAGKSFGYTLKLLAIGKTSCRCHILV